MRSPNSSEAVKSNAKVSEFVPAILLAVSILLAVFSAYPDYYALTAKKDEHAQVMKERSDKSAELAKLDSFKTQSATPAFAADIARYAAPFREDELIDSLFAPGFSAGILPLSIGIEKGSKMPNGLMQGTLDVTLRAGNQAALMKYYEFLTGTTGKKRFVIKSTNFSFDSTSPKNGTFQVSVSLGFSHYSPR